MQESCFSFIYLNAILIMMTTATCISIVDKLKQSSDKVKQHRKLLFKRKRWGFFPDYLSLNSLKSKIAELVSSVGSNWHFSLLNFMILSKLQAQLSNTMHNKMLFLHIGKYLVVVLRPLFTPQTGWKQSSWVASKTIGRTHQCLAENNLSHCFCLEVHPDSRPSSSYGAFQFLLIITCIAPVSSLF